MARDTVSKSIATKLKENMEPNANIKNRTKINKDFLHRKFVTYFESATGNPYCKHYFDGPHVCTWTRDGREIVPTASRTIGWPDT